jgi:hypothetical protein
MDYLARLGKWITNPGYGSEKGLKKIRKKLHGILRNVLKMATRIIVENLLTLKCKKKAKFY